MVKKYWLFLLLAAHFEVLLGIPHSGLFIWQLKLAMFVLKTSFLKKKKKTV